MEQPGVLEVLGQILEEVQTLRKLYRANNPDPENGDLPWETGTSNAEAVNAGYQVTFTIEIPQGSYDYFMTKWGAFELTGHDFMLDIDGGSRYWDSNHPPQSNTQRADMYRPPIHITRKFEIIVQNLSASNDAIGAIKVYASGWMRRKER